MNTTNNVNIHLPLRRKLNAMLEDLKIIVEEMAKQDRFNHEQNNEIILKKEKIRKATFNLMRNVEIFDKFLEELPKDSLDNEELNLNNALPKDSLDNEKLNLNNGLSKDSLDNKELNLNNALPKDSLDNEKLNLNNGLSKDSLDNKESNLNNENSDDPNPVLDLTSEFFNNSNSNLEDFDDREVVNAAKNIPKFDGNGCSAALFIKKCKEFLRAAHKNSYEEKKLVLVICSNVEGDVANFILEKKIRTAEDLVTALHAYYVLLPRQNKKYMNIIE